MSNLTTLNDHLFKQMDRLNQEGMEKEALEVEIKRSHALTGLAREVIANAQLVFDAAVKFDELHSTAPDILGITKQQ